MPIRVKIRLELMLPKPRSDEIFSLFVVVGPEYVMTEEELPAAPTLEAAARDLRRTLIEVIGIDERDLSDPKIHPIIERWKMNLWEC